MQKIVIVGTSCSGKTTLGKNLGSKLGIAPTDLDDLYWLPNWENISREELGDKVEEVTARDSWIISGNYSSVKDRIWPKADTIIWLNYSFGVTWKRAIHRTLRRSLTGELCCNGNRESLFKAFCTRDSILLWVLKTYWRRKREYPQEQKNPEYSHVHFVEFNSPQQTEGWLKAIA